MKRKKGGRESTKRGWKRKKKSKSLCLPPGRVTDRTRMRWSNGRWQVLVEAGKVRVEAGNCWPVPRTATNCCRGCGAATRSSWWMQIVQRSRTRRMGLYSVASAAAAYVPSSVNPWAKSFVVDKQVEKQKKRRKGGRQQTQRWTKQTQR
jgi:hypothetical protein